MHTRPLQSWQWKIQHKANNDTGDNMFRSMSRRHFQRNVSRELDEHLSILQTTGLVNNTQHRTTLKFASQLPKTTNTTINEDVFPKTNHLVWNLNLLLAQLTG